VDGVDSNGALAGTKSAAAFECFMSACRQLNKMSARRQLHLLAPSIVGLKKLVPRETNGVRNANVIRMRDWFEKLWRSNDARFQEMDLSFMSRLKPRPTNLEANRNARES
jgi:hypothetical protein